MISARAGCWSLSRKASRAFAAVDRVGGTPGVWAGCSGGLPGCLTVVPVQVAVGGASEGVGNAFKETDLPLVERGEQQSRRVVEDGFAAQVAGGPPGPPAALLAVALLGPGGLGRGHSDHQLPRIRDAHAG